LSGYATDRDIVRQSKWRSHRVHEGQWMPYQQSSLAKIRKPEDLIGGFFDGLTELPAGVTMFTGTIPTIGEITGAEHFAIALVDPGRSRTLWRRYGSPNLPVII
jgi:hypothetical protein